MLQQLMAAATGGTLKISHVYIGHIKKDDDRKVLAHADAFVWDDVEPTLRAVLESHLYQAIEGTEGEVNFACHYRGEVLTVGKVASEEYDRTKNRPAVEVLEAIRDFKPEPSAAIGQLGPLIDLGNNLAYKVLSAGAIRNHLVAMLKFAIVPQLGAQPINFSFATVVDLDDREESFFDERAGKFITTPLHNVIKKAKVSRACFFPCLGDDGREVADLLVYAGSGAGAWFKALEVMPRLSPQAEGKALIRMIAEQICGVDVRTDLFQALHAHLDDGADNQAGLHVMQVATALEKAMGMGIDRLGFQARWESAYGDLSYRPSFASLFGSKEVDPAQIKLIAGGLEFKLTAERLHYLRQIQYGGSTFLLVAIPQLAKLAVGKDLEIRLATDDMDQGINWMTGKISAL